MGLPRKLSARVRDCVAIGLLLTGLVTGQQTSTPAAPPLSSTLQDALERARFADPQYHAALTDLGVARQERVQARAGLLPNVSYNNSFIYTQGTGQPAGCAVTATCPASRFIANNGVHEYISE